LPRLAEVKAVRMVMENIRTRSVSKEFWISCVFPDYDELPDGSSISEVVTTMLFE
jgi:S-methylmethionine-dependent homocysteine/selenocysteine methylase